MKKLFYRIDSFKRPYLILGFTRRKQFSNDSLQYALLETRLILRNKRLQGFTFIASVLLLLFSLILPNAQLDLYFGFIVYTLISGIFGYVFSQYMFSWESSFFDFIYTKNFNIGEYIRAKYFIYTISSLIVFFLFIPVKTNYSESRILLLLTASFYNISVGYFLFFLSATMNSSKIDLEGHILFNLQGFNPIQMLMLVFILFLPCLILFILKHFLTVKFCLIFLNLFCLISLINSSKWFSAILSQLNKRKYKNLEGYNK